MRRYLLRSSCLLLSCMGLSSLRAQLVVNGGTLTINSNAVISVQGNLTSNVDILGAGKIVMNGSTVQQLNTNGSAIPNLEINSTGEVQLTGNTKVSTNLNFVTGKIKTGNFDLVMSSAATSTGQGTDKFVWTNGTGQLKKELSGDVSLVEFPLGENNNYKPAFLTTSGSTYNAANVGVRLDSLSPNTPPKIANAIKATWRVSRTGITGGTTRLTGQYTDADVVGTEANLSGYYFNGTDWSSATETHDNATNRISSLVTNANGQVSAMNKFVAVGARVILQGAYNATTGLMSDLLRNTTSAVTPKRLIPLSDPYRTAPFSTGTIPAYVHVNNAAVETADTAVFSTKSPVDNNIVDWVFLQLRNTNSSPGNTVLQTRSALLQRDGDIVDIDGVSPVTFNIQGGTYALTVRHRNHLGLSLNPTTSAKSMNETSSTAFTSKVIDFRTITPAQLFGTASNYATANHPTLGSVKLLWGGNANYNANVRYNSGGNDKDVIFTASSSPASSNIYSPADINLNRSVRFNSGGNDKDFLYLTVLGGAVTNSRLQAIPN